jgi:hypothetical protein
MTISKKKIMDGYIEWELLDPKGRVVKRGRQPVKSWVKAWILFLYASFGNANVSVTDTGGTSRTINAGYSLVAYGGTGDSRFGIVVGSSDTPVNRDDYKLGSQISHGSSTGQLMYGGGSVDAPVTYSTGYLTRIIRVFTNNSGADITVKEIGIYAYWGTTPYFLCIIRDVLTTPVTIPNGYSLTVRYNFYFVV